MSNITEKDVWDVLSKIKHPVVEANIVELGIIKKITMQNNIAAIILSFPFIGAAAKEISVRDKIITDVKKAIEDLELKFYFTHTEMKQKEFERFLAFEKKSWEKFNKSNFS